MADYSDLQRDKQNAFYRDYYPQLIFTLMLAIVIMFGTTGVVFYQVFHRPQPEVNALTPGGQKMMLRIHDEPNLLPTTILQWAKKAAVASYTFDFVNYNKEIGLAREYFTPNGWADYQSSVAKLIGTITQNQLFVNGVVAGTAVISNEGPLPGKGYVWRVQMPFLVTYQSAEKTSQQRFTVIMNIVRVPTSVNPSSIGVDQFVMS